MIVSVRGTRAFIAKCRRLLDRCVVEGAKGDPRETRQALEMIFALLRHLDEGNDDVIFFADEGGSWQVGVDWKKVFPAWFRCLARTAQADAFAQAVVEAVDEFEEFARDEHFAAARRLASAAQRRALDGRAVSKARR